MVKIEVNDNGSVTTMLAGSSLKVAGELGLSFAMAIWKLVGGNEEAYRELTEVLYKANTTDELIEHMKNTSIDTRASVRTNSKDEFKEILDALRKEGDGHVS